MSKTRLVLRTSSRSVLPSIDAVVARERPTEPLVCLRPAAIAAASRRFAGIFPDFAIRSLECGLRIILLRMMISRTITN